MAPTDRSIDPIMMIKAAPEDTIMRIEVDRRILRILPRLRNAGDKTEKTIITVKSRQPARTNGRYLA